MGYRLRDIVAWTALLAWVVFCTWCAYDWVTFNVRDLRGRVVALEQESRPLIVVDRFSEVLMCGEEVYSAREWADSERGNVESAGEGGENDP